MDMTDTTPEAHLVELRLHDVHQLFNTMDPSPFREKDLDRDAEEFIESWAREHPVAEPLTLRVHLEEWPADDPTALIRDAIHNFFDYRGRLADLEFRQLMRQGRVSLAIGVLFLGACLTATQLLVHRADAFAAYAREGLTIVGWVAMWRPMQIYLYDWWPVKRQRRHFARLSVMPIEVVKSA